MARFPHGISRFSRTQNWVRRGIRDVKAKKAKPAKKPVAKPQMVIEKKIGGAKNGGVRKIRAFKTPSFYSVVPKKGKAHSHRAQHAVPLRKSITPGTVLILLAGRFAGKRVVFLKQLTSGLLLVSGPFKVNGVPLRRVNQRYVIATSTKVDVSSVKIPEGLDDSLFKKTKASRYTIKKNESNFYSTEKKLVSPFRTAAINIHAHHQH